MIIRQKQKIIQVRQEHCKGFSHTEEKIITTVYFLWIPISVKERIIKHNL